MDCLKCGKKTTDEQVFCTQCLEIMEAYPVKPDVHIQLPNRPAPVSPKRASRRRRNLSADEQVSLLRKRLRRLTAALILVSLLLAAAGVSLGYVLTRHPDSELGKNYTFVGIFD